jgi:hypothetical protein
MATLLRRDSTEAGCAVDVATAGEDGVWMGTEIEFDAIMSRLTIFLGSHSQTSGSVSPYSGERGGEHPSQIEATRRRSRYGEDRHRCTQTVDAVGMLERIRDPRAAAGGRIDELSRYPNADRVRWTDMVGGPAGRLGASCERRRRTIPPALSR